MSHRAVTLKRSWSIVRLGSWCQSTDQQGAPSTTHMHALGDFAAAHDGDVEHFGGPGLG
jgi:hypothetical protein